MQDKVLIQMAGIRNLKDALMCCEMGVDIIGLLVGQKHMSDDFLTAKEAKYIAKNLPADVLTTLITHLEKAKEIIKLAKTIAVDNIQLHSYINEREVEKIAKALPKAKLLRLIHILENGQIQPDISKIKYVDFFFTDSINTKTNQVGGTGLIHDYNIDKQLVATLPKPVFVAGGLNFKNVQEIVEKTKCFGVDVNSGCRANDGSRDKELTLKFVQAVRRAKI